MAALKVHTLQDRFNSGDRNQIMNHSISGEISCLSRSAGGFDSRMVLQFQSGISSFGRAEAFQAPGGRFKSGIPLQVHGQSVAVHAAADQTVGVSFACTASGIVDMRKWSSKPTQGN